LYFNQYWHVLPKNNKTIEHLCVILPIISQEYLEVQCFNGLVDWLLILIWFYGIIDKGSSIWRNKMADIVLDNYYMRQALDLAVKAAHYDEAPVGALIVVDDHIVGEGYNQREGGRDATLHAEMIAIRAACSALGGWRLPRSTMYVTLEPCPMCAGALVQARVERLVFAAADPKAGAAGTVMDIVRCQKLNHRLEVKGGVLEEEAANLLSQFFAAKRRKNSVT
jgi:tRNA(adenine34) deaminase